MLPQPTSCLAQVLLLVTRALHTSEAATAATAVADAAAMTASKRLFIQASLPLAIRQGTALQPLVASKARLMAMGLVVSIATVYCHFGHGCIFGAGELGQESWGRRGGDTRSSGVGTLWAISSCLESSCFGFVTCWHADLLPLVWYPPSLHGTMIVVPPPFIAQPWKPGNNNMACSSFAALMVLQA
jgi:hypothetical protein